MWYLIVSIPDLCTLTFVLTIVIIVDLSHGVASGSVIMLCNKVDLQIYGKRYDVHNNVAYMTQSYFFYASVILIDSCIIQFIKLVAKKR